MSSDATAYLDDPHQVGNSTQRSAWKDCLAGVSGGVAQVLVGQPFDCLKVRLQTQPDQFKSTIDCINKTLKYEGPLAFYKGTVMPLACVGLAVSVQFTVFESIKRVFHYANAGGSLSAGQYYMSGLVAGVANSFLIAPIELVRIRLQTQTTGVKAYSGPVDCVQKIVKNHGINGLYRGYLSTLLREANGMGMYFMAYEALINRDIVKNKRARSEIPVLNLVTYGSAAGYAMWLTSYPVDVIKSRLQTDNFVKPVYKSATDCFRKMVGQEGFRSLFRGFLPVLVRAAPVNGATFVAYEIACSYLY